MPQTTTSEIWLAEPQRYKSFSLLWNGLLSVFLLWGCLRALSLP